MAKTRTEAKASGAADCRAHHTIVSCEVTGGFLKGVKLEFVDGLNCIIGGRGTGKTTVLEVIRYVLGLAPDERARPARAKAFRTLVQNNLGAGRVRLTVRTKHGMEYVAERPWNDTTQVFDEHGEATAISFDRDLIFKADVYSQNEIEEIATDPTFQLALLDKFVEEDVRRIEHEIRKLQRDLELNASELLRVDRLIRDHQDSAAEVNVIAEKLKGLQQKGGPDAKQVNAAHTQRSLRERERKTLEALRADLRRVHSEVDSVFGGLVRRLHSRVDEDVAKGPNKDVFEVVGRHIQELTALLERGARKIGEQAQAAEGAVDEQERQLAQRHAKQDAEYRTLVATSQEEIGRATERTKLQQRYAEVTTAKKELELRQTERRQLEERRQELAARLSELRDERFRKRQDVADHLSEALGPEIRVTITQAGNRIEYRRLLTEALKGQSMKYGAVVDRIVERVTPEELSLSIQRDDAAGLGERADLDEDRCAKVIAALRDTDLLYRIETVELEDVPRIELRDGRDYKESADLSTGQRCTTILPILLLESERPLLVDQPEDNLDNKYIYDTVVKRLKAAKGRRQLIFVTHNPNIPVLGDAERVFVLDSDGKQGRLHKAGTVDDLKKDVELLLEGGSEAFLERQKRYGH